MMRHLFLLAPLALSGPVAAEVPRVVTDIAPVHALVARVMDGLGEPSVLLRPGTSPHGYALRPSDAAKLEAADLVFWIGPELTPWLNRPLETLAAAAEVLELLEVEGTRTLGYRSETVFDTDTNNRAGEAAHEPADEHPDDDGDDHGHETEPEGDDGEHAHGEGLDPHAWLDPENGKQWLAAIAAALATADPENAAIYAANAAEGQAEIDATSAAISERLAARTDRGYVVFHDAYQYFETRFGLSPLGAIALSDASAPGPARLSEIREAVLAANVVCVFAETQFPQKLVTTVLEGTGARLSVIDPLGADIAPGPDFYTALLSDLANRMTACF